jgi:hypothetical protein
MDNIKIGFIGLGNVGGKLAGSLVRHGLDLTVRDLNAQLEADFVRRGATRAVSPREMAARVDVIITCLPSPAACAQVVEGTDGILAGLTPGKVWLEMSTTDAAEIRRLGALIEARGAWVMDCPVSGAVIAPQPAISRSSPAASACWVWASHRRCSMRSPKRRATRYCLNARAAARRDRTSWPGSCAGTAPRAAPASLSLH